MSRPLHERLIEAVLDKGELFALDLHARLGGALGIATGPTIDSLRQMAAEEPEEYYAWMMYLNGFKVLGPWQTARMEDTSAVLLNRWQIQVVGYHDEAPEPLISLIATHDALYIWSGITGKLYTGQYGITVETRQELFESDIPTILAHPLVQRVNDAGTLQLQAEGWIVLPNSP